MSIDAKIAKVERNKGKLVLSLKSYMRREGVMSIRGRPEIHIVEWTHTPSVGQLVWGGNTLIIEPSHGIMQRWHYKQSADSYIEYHEIGTQPEPEY